MSHFLIFRHIMSKFFLILFLHLYNQVSLILHLYNYQLLSTYHFVLISLLAFASASTLSLVFAVTPFTSATAFSIIFSGSKRIVFFVCFLLIVFSPRLLYHTRSQNASRLRPNSNLGKNTAFTSYNPTHTALDCLINPDLRVFKHFFFKMAYNLFLKTRDITLAYLQLVSNLFLRHLVVSCKTIAHGHYLHFARTKG